MSELGPARSASRSAKVDRSDEGMPSDASGSRYDLKMSDDMASGEATGRPVNDENGDGDGLTNEVRKSESSAPELDADAKAFSSADVDGLTSGDDALTNIPGELA